MVHQLRPPGVGVPPPTREGGVRQLPRTALRRGKLFWREELFRRATASGEEGARRASSAPLRQEEAGGGAPARPRRRRPGGLPRRARRVRLQSGARRERTAREQEEGDARRRQDKELSDLLFEQANAAARVFDDKQTGWRREAEEQAKKYIDLVSSSDDE